MQDILVLGAGKIGSLITGLLAESGDYRVQLVDAVEGAAAGVAEAHGLDPSIAFRFDASDEQQLTGHVRKNKPVAVISGLPFYCNVAVAKVARAANLHYFDLTEDVAVTNSVRAMAKGAATAFVPQCGLAPGFISIAANELISTSTSSGP
jgi:saccharopine dehydrogenase-like NADP-dependent oxidoreductase